MSSSSRARQRAPRFAGNALFHTVAIRGRKYYREAQKGSAAGTSWMRLPQLARTEWAVFLTTALAVVGNIIWVQEDHQSPAWDQANYLHISLLWRHGFAHGGIGGFLRAIYNVAPSFPPLYMLFITPFQAIAVGVGPALVANTLIYAATIVAAALIATKLYGQRAAFLSALFTATCPLLFGLSRTVLVDILLALLCTLAVMAIVFSDGFLSTGWSICVGIFAGLAMLTKFTTPAMVIGPALFGMLLPVKLRWRRQLRNAALGTIASLIVTLPWYIPELGPSLTYLHYATSGSGAIGTTPHPLALPSLFSYLSGVADDGLGAVLAIILLLAACAVAPAYIRRRPSRTTIARVAVPLTWLLVPFLVVMTEHNQDIRFLVPGVVGIAVLASGLLSKIQSSALRKTFSGIACVVLSWQFVTYIQPVPGFGAAVETLSLSSAGTLVVALQVPLDGQALGYARAPGIPDYAGPILTGLEDASHKLDVSGPLTICLLESQEVVNTNTISFEAAERGDNFLFTDLSYIPRMSAPQLASALTACPLALYIPPAPSAYVGRVAVLNSASAAARITPPELAQFDVLRPNYPVGNGLNVEILERKHRP